MTLLRSALLSAEGFGHGFGTRRSTPGDYPADVHILLQVHGERIVCLTGVSEEGKRRKGEKEKNSTEAGLFPSSPLPLFPFSEPEVVPMSIHEHHFRFTEGDALVTDIPGTTLGIRTADCLPVLVGDAATGAVAAIHCGWRSLALGLAGKGVRTLLGLTGSSPGSLAAAIGPSIGPCCCEVGPEVKGCFDHEANMEGLFETRDGRLYLDLAAGVKTQLLAAGMAPDAIEEITGCTKCDDDMFWSYRGGDKEERMVSWITAKEAGHST